MRRVERQREVAQQAPNFVRRKTTLAPRSLGERFAMHVLHDDVDQIADFTEPEHRDDPRMAESRRQPRLASKTLAVLFRGRKLVAQRLDRDEAVQGDVTGEKHNAHAAATELANHLILRAEQIGDPITLPSTRDRERRRRGHLERICVGIDE